jgi:hypothetical protein
LIVTFHRLIASNIHKPENLTLKKSEKMSGIIFAILFLAFLTVAFLAWYFTHKTREKERLIMLEKGMELPELSNGWQFNFRFPWLKAGFVITGIGLGLLVGTIAENVTSFRGAALEPVMMLLFGGIGMIIAHYVDRKDK